MGGLSCFMGAASLRTADAFGTAALSLDDIAGSGNDYGSNYSHKDDICHITPSFFQVSLSAAAEGIFRRQIPVGPLYQPHQHGGKGAYGDEAGDKARPQSTGGGQGAYLVN